MQLGLPSGFSIFRQQRAQVVGRIGGSAVGVVERRPLKSGQGAVDGIHGDTSA
jgi:hypothetical protein